MKNEDWFWFDRTPPGNRRYKIPTVAPAKQSGYALEGQAFVWMIETTSMPVMLVVVVNRQNDHSRIMCWKVPEYEVRAVGVGSSL